MRRARGGKVVMVVLWREIDIIVLVVIIVVKGKKKRG
jgi:hypothetical protein